jgi:maltose alpha-D-glucosyltransferase/alpha-amylase
MIGEENPLWYKDAIIYQLHVRSFADSDGDGVGDFQGLTEKLDYLQDLGVTAIWLLPFYPSPLKDDGYDIADYTDVHPMYGNLHDFRAFLERAHQRNLRVITELVINHTSSQHPWFQRARRAPPDSSWRNFYMWSDTTEKYHEARIIFKDFEFSNWSWDPVARAYYWHRFYSHQPDLNFDNPEVHEELFKIVDFWLGMGVDGLRLDAIPYLYAREGTNCENLPETHAFLKKLRHHVDSTFQSRMLLAEANQWPEDAVAYFGAGDECHMAFHFPLMPRIFIAARMEDRFPIVETLHHTPPIPETSQWALFLRNHDELTLEMVTAEERSFMYRTYARNPRARINLGIRRRLAPLLQNSRPQIELLNGLLFSLPGTPVIYYGDEIGMGDNIYLGDRDGVRTPMQWSHGLNAGFSHANPQRVFLPVVIDPEYHYEAINVEAQNANSHSLLHWMKQLIAIRKSYRALSRGSLNFLTPENRKVLAFLRRYHDEHDEEIILGVANLSRFIQCVELDLSAFEGMVPVELSGRTIFPPIGELPYFLTLGSYSFYWFALEHSPTTTRHVAPVSSEGEAPLLELAGEWATMFAGGRARVALEEILPSYLKQRRWFGGKARDIQAATLLEAMPISYDSSVAYLTLVEVEYLEGDQEIYVLPFTADAGEQAEQIARDYPQIVAARLICPGESEPLLLYDALRDSDFARVLLDALSQHRSFRGSVGEMMASSVRAFSPRSSPRDISADPPPLDQVAQVEIRWENQPHADSNPASSDGFMPPVMIYDQGSTTMRYDTQFVLKMFRRVEAGPNPDLEIGRFLTEKISLARAPLVHGALEYVQKNSDPITLGVLRAFVPNQGTAWHYTLDALRGYRERVHARAALAEPLPVPDGHLLDRADEEVSGLAHELVASYLESARLLGQRTAELHMALAQETDDQNFVPEPFTDFFQRPFYHAMLGLMDRSFHQIKRRLPHLPEPVQETARGVVMREETIRACFQPFRDRKLTAMRIRCHGNYHLGQVLCADDDFVIIDFEGEAGRSLEERRTKTPPLRDVAGLLRSFYYAACGVVVGNQQENTSEHIPLATRLSWAHFWYVHVATVFLRAYFEAAHEAPLLLQTRDETRILLDAYLLERAFYELEYEFAHRPEYIGIPLQGILHLLQP